MQSRASLITTNFRTDKVWELPMEIKACEDFELTSRYTKLNSTDLTGKITRRRDLTWSASSVLYGALSALNLVRVVWANLNFLLWDAAYPLGRSTPKSSFIPPSACFPLDPTKADNTLNFLWFQADMLRNASYQYVCGFEWLIRAASCANAGHNGWCNGSFARISIAGRINRAFRLRWLYIFLSSPRLPYLRGLKCS